MLEVRTVLCPVDLSSHSSAVLRHAFALARDRGARLVILHALDPLLAQAASIKLGENLEDDVRRELDALVAAIEAPPGALREPPTCLVRTGEPFRVLLDTARALPADVLVMGTHGHTGAARLFFGSTLARVLREAVVPVIALGPASPAIYRETAEGPVIEIRWVIAAVDVKSPADHVIGIAGAIAARHHCPALLVHVVVPPQGLARWQKLLEAHEKEDITRAEDRLRLYARELERQSIPTDILVSAGQVEDVISELSGQQEQTLIVLGLRDVPAVIGPQPGSTAYRVLSKSKAPVLVVPLAPAASANA